MQTGDVSWAESGVIRKYSQTLNADGVAVSKVFPKGTLLVSIAANIGDAALLDFDAACPDSVIAITPGENLDTRYLRYFLNTRQRWIQYLAPSGTQKNINVDILEDVEVEYPSITNQRKIAEILSEWDVALEKFDALVSAMKRRKQGLMQQLLHVAVEKAGHGHTRHRVGNVVERVTRKNIIGNDNVLTISAQDGLINQREYFNRSVAGADLSGYFLLQRGEFAYNRSSSIGYPYGAIKRMDRYDQGIVSTLYLCFRVRDTAQISSDYLAHYLDGGYLNSGLRAIAKEGARAHGLLNVSADEFMDLDIFLPPLPLQEKISAILDAADKELRLLHDQRTALDEQKRGLMQQLLTGQKRVTTQPQ